MGKAAAFSPVDAALEAAAISSRSCGSSCDLGSRWDQHDEAIRVLQELDKALVEEVQRLAFERQRLRDENGFLRETEALEREKMALRLENELLKFERRLPGSPD